MPNFGALSAAAGAAQGIASGVDAFFNTRTRLNEEAIKKQLANAQTIDAYAKLTNVMTPNQIGGILRQQGLIPDAPQGMLQTTQQPTQNLGSNMKMTSPGFDSAARAAGPSSNPNVGGSNQLAPDGMPDVGNMLPWQKEQALKEYNTKWEQEQPQAKATLQNATNVPKDQAMGQAKPYVDRMTSVASSYTSAMNLLNNPTPQSPKLIFSYIAHMAQPDSNKPQLSVEEAIQKEPQLWNRLTNDVSLKTTGRFSEETTKDLKETLERLYQPEAANYKSSVEFLKANAPQGSNLNLDIPIMKQIESQRRSKKTKQTGEESGGEGGLLGTNALAGGKGAKPPGGHMTVTQGGHKYKWNGSTGKYE